MGRTQVVRFILFTSYSGARRRCMNQLLGAPHPNGVKRRAVSADASDSESNALLQGGIRRSIGLRFRRTEGAFARTARVVSTA